MGLREAGLRHCGLSLGIYIYISEYPHLYVRNTNLYSDRNNRNECKRQFNFRLNREIERKAMIRNRYNYPTPPIRDNKGKETQRNNWTLIETSLAESQMDSYFPTKYPNVYPKRKDVSDTHIQRRTVKKKNHDRRIALERSVKSISLGSLNQFYVSTILALTSAAA